MKKFHVLLLVLMYVLAGCSQHTEEQGGGTVAAIVNGVEITKRQVEYSYKRAATQKVSEEEAVNLKRRILKNLIQTELFAEKGKSMKLDRSSDYAMERYVCEKNALARLAKNELVDKKAQVSDEEATAFVNNHPELFAQRKLFLYDTLLISGAETSFLESLDAMVEKGAKLGALVEQLRAKNIPFATKREMNPSEKIPEAMRNILLGLKRDVPQVIIFDNSRSMLLVLRDSNPAPLTGPVAEQAAKALLSSVRQRILTAQEMKDLVDHAEITYFDEYSTVAGEEGALAELPVPDKNRVNRELLKQSAFAGIFFFSFILAVMDVTVGMRIISERSWLPRLWKKKKDPATLDKGMGVYAERYVPPVYRSFYVFLLFALLFGAIVADIRFLWSSIPLWALFACIAVGGLAGIFASRLFNAKIFSTWRRKRYMIAAAILAVPVLAGTLFIKLFRPL